jgi:RNA polymerase sigma-70 factor, ECF subfamily
MFISMNVKPHDTRDSLIARLNSPADVAAWNEVMSIYGPLVYRVAIQQGLQKADAEDVVQEVFTVVLRSVGEWLDQPKRGRFRSWLSGICRNTSLNVLNRRPKGAVGLGGTEAIEAMNRLEEAVDDVSSAFDIEYKREIYRWAIKKVKVSVSQSTWDAFYKTHVEGRPIADVSSELGVKTGSIYLARSRVMRRLRELVKQYREASDDQTE